MSQPLDSQKVAESVKLNQKKAGKNGKGGCCGGSSSSKK